MAPAHERVEREGERAEEHAHDQERREERMRDPTLARGKKIIAAQKGRTLSAEK